MGPKRRNLSRSTSSSRRYKRARTTESEEHRESRLAANREQIANARANETDDHRDARQQIDRIRRARIRASESHDSRAARQAVHRENTSRNRAAQRDARLEIDRIRQARSQIPSDLNLTAFHYNSNLNYGGHRSVLIGEMNKLCGYCAALKFKNETPGMCCAGGKVVLPELLPPPEPLFSLFEGISNESKHFLANIRKYNSCFQMTSFGAQRIIRGGFMPTFKVQGQVYHRLGSLLPAENEQHKYLQIYFMGNSQAEADRRCENIIDTNRDTVLQLQQLLHENNALVHLFKTALDQMPADDYVVVIRADKIPVGTHERQYNAPTINEVAVLMVGDQFNSRDIVLQRRAGDLKRISETHRSYDALQYPLLFPSADDGYHFAIKMRNPITGEETDKKVSSMNYYAYRLMIRQGTDNHILRARQLFHQYAVDMYVKIESERLLYIRLNQTKLRSEEYIHLRDAITSDATLNPQNLGKRVILPATFTGSPRHMHEYSQDAMTYVRSYGRPDLFITFTCNPTWDEISALLRTGESSTDRPDIGARVFKQKLKALMDLIVKQRAFGETRCWMYSVEWQKRGLPHAHILIWLAEKIRPHQIDSIISAEIPDRASDPVLFDVVTKNMIHGPCGALNPNSPCMVNGKCTKRYPRNLTSQTITGNDGYPLYRRRSIHDGGRIVAHQLRNNHIEIDNRWIVPYSPLLSKTFKAHINVEYCNSVKSIKYICKYVTKGSDMAVFTVGSADDDEIQRYQSGRYISTNEALWRIFSFQIHERSPTVVHLAIHLENGQRVYFTATNARERASTPPQTTLTAFFALCANDPFAKTLLYSEVPKYYVWIPATKKFQRRKQGKQVPGHPSVRSSDALGRIYTVHPNNHECFFLRLLLVNVRGPTSFEELRTVNGEVCTTYRTACLRLNLLEHDAHWDSTLGDAAATARPHQIRTLFAIILTTCAPSNPQNLWDKYKDQMSEDFLHHLRVLNHDPELQFTPRVYNEALISIEDLCLAIANKFLIQLALNAPDRSLNDTYDRDLNRETQFDNVALRQFVDRNLSRLLPEQIDAYKMIMRSIRYKSGGLLFLDAPGGTGKTFLLSLILAVIRSQSKIAVAIASSGIAATLLDGGRTAHSALKLQLDLHTVEEPLCGVKKNSGMGTILRTCEIIIWDECTMSHKRALEALDRTLKDFRGNQQPFGGALILLSGDFRQTLPVIPRSTPADELNACLKSSILWRHVQKLTLRTNMRVQLQRDQSAEVFANQLLQIGEGKIRADASTQCISFPIDFCKFSSSLDELIHNVFPELNRNFTERSWLRGRAILAPTNNDVSAINLSILNRIPGQMKSYESVDHIIDLDQAVNYPVEFLNSLELPGVPPHTLSLKIGAPIILLRNIHPPQLCNGTRLAVKALMNNVIEATILNGKFEGEHVLIPRIPIIPNDLPFTFKRLQFPVKLAFAMTINKAQGQSLQVCGLNLENHCFSHGQLYVACSRVGKPQDLHIYAPGHKTKNIVYPQALQ